MGKCLAISIFVLVKMIAVVIGFFMTLSKCNDVWLDQELSSLATTTVEELPDEVQKWHNRGKYVEINGLKMFYILVDLRQKLGSKRKLNDLEDPGNTTLILIHGYPTSSYDYHRAVDNHLIPLLKNDKGDPGKISIVYYTRSNV